MPDIKQLARLAAPSANVGSRILPQFVGVGGTLASAAAATNPYAALIAAAPYIIQGGIGLGQLIAGGKKRQDIDTSVNPIYQQQVQETKNLAQSTSQAFDTARRNLASQYAANLSAAQRGATSSGSLLRQQQVASRAAAQGGAQIYMGELQAQRSDLERTMQAKSNLARAQERSQALKNQIAMQENAALDQMQASGVSNMFGALQGYATYNIAKEQSEAMKSGAFNWMNRTLYNK